MPECFNDICTILVPVEEEEEEEAQPRSSQFPLRSAYLDIFRSGPLHIAFPNSA